MNFCCGITYQALELKLVTSAIYKDSNRPELLVIKLDKMNLAYKSLHVHHHTLTELNMFQIKEADFDLHTHTYIYIYIYIYTFL